MRRLKALGVAAVLAALFALPACSRDDSGGKGGPAERAGRELDKALNKAGQAVEKAGKDMQKSSKGDSTEGK